MRNPSLNPYLKFLGAPMHTFKQFLTKYGEPDMDMTPRARTRKKLNPRFDTSASIRCNSQIKKKLKALAEFRETDIHTITNNLWARYIRDSFDELEFVQDFEVS